MASDPQARALVETVDRLVPVCTNQRKLGMRTMTALVIHRFDVYLHHPNVPRNEDGMPVYNVAVFMRYVWTTAVADMFSRSSGPRFWVSMAYRGMADPQNEHAVCKHTRLEIQGSAGFTATLPACNDRRQVEAILGARDDDAFVFPERAMREIFQALASQLVLNIVHHVTVPFVRRARQHLLGLCRDIVPGARVSRAMAWLAGRSSVLPPADVRAREPSRPRPPLVARQRWDTIHATRRGRQRTTPGAARDGQGGYEQVPPLELGRRGGGVGDAMGPPGQCGCLRPRSTRDPAGPPGVPRAG